MKRMVKGLAAFAVALGVAQAGHAQTTYGCSDLDGFHSLPSVEGSEGMFFRVEPELYNHHPFSDETVQDIAVLSRALAAQGTTLVYAPVPPKAMVLSQNLPQRAFDYGFDPDIATTLYDDMIQRLQAAGVNAVNLRHALVLGSTGYGAPYFQADFRLNTQGARIAAQAIAQHVTQAPTFARASRGRFASESIGKVEVDSDMRRVLQRHCLIELPKTDTEGFALRSGAGANAPSQGNGTQFNANGGFAGNSQFNNNAQFGNAAGSFVNSGQTGNGGFANNAQLGNTPQFATPNTALPNAGFANAGQQAPNNGQFGTPGVFNSGNNTGVFSPSGGSTAGASAGGQVVLVGTEYSATPEINLAGFLSEMTGTEVQNRAIAGGGAFGSISAYMTSDAFMQSRPAVLIWENPVYNNLARFGDQPWRELVAAGGGNCRLPVPVLSSLDSTAVRADLSGLDPMQDYTLMVETGGSVASQAQFVFTSPLGATRTSTVTRRTEQEKTGRFFVPVTGFWREGVRTLEIRLNAPFAGTPRITACMF